MVCYIPTDGTNRPTGLFVLWCRITYRRGLTEVVYLFLRALLEPGLWDKRIRFLRLFCIILIKPNKSAESQEPVSKQCQVAMHIGEAIRKELERQEKTVVWLAEQIPCHRTNVYRIFEKDSIDTRTLMRISNILKHDFFADHSIELKQKKNVVDIE